MTDDEFKKEQKRIREQESSDRFADRLRAATRDKWSTDEIPVLHEDEKPPKEKKGKHKSW